MPDDSVQTAVAVGSPAPDFELPTDGGGQMRLADLRGRNVVLYFYPADDTEGCTLEAVDFTAFLPPNSSVPGRRSSACRPIRRGRMTVSRRSTA